jgi:hypothetical protein
MMVLIVVGDTFSSFFLFRLSLCIPTQAFLMVRLVESQLEWSRFILVFENRTVIFSVWQVK